MWNAPFLTVRISMCVFVHVCVVLQLDDTRDCKVHEAVDPY